MTAVLSAGRLPVILQSECNECGLAALAMVLNFHGHRIGLGTLRSRFAVSRNGLSLKALMQLADELHLTARALRLEPENLENLALPAILHWDLKHFVVLKKTNHRGVVLHDPAKGEVRASWAEVERSFTGVALELSPAQGFARKQETEKLQLQQLWQGSRGLWRSLGQLLLLSALIQFFALALPYYTQLFIDEVLVTADLALLKILATGFLMVTLTRSITDLLRAWVVLHLGNSISFHFGTALCRHLLRLPLDWFQKRHLGDIVSRFGSLTNVKDFLAAGIVEAGIDGLMVLATLILMYVYSPMLTLVALLAVVLYLLMRLFLYMRLRTCNNELIHTRATENSLFMENVRAIQGIRLYGKESERLNCWQNAYADVINAGIRVQWLGIHLKFVHGLLMGSENIVLLLLGGLAVLNNQISIGMLMAYLSFKDQFYTRVFALMDKLFEFRLLELHLERLADIALQEPESRVETMAFPALFNTSQSGLCASNLGFRYHAEEGWLFRHLNLQVESEEVIAIVGPSGCGKSTLLKVLLSLLRAGEGDLSLNGMSLSAMGLAGYRRQVAGVLQDDVLLTGSLLDNITFFDLAPDREKVEEVAELAGIAGDIRRLPMQYNSMVGSMGAALSGGQVQRLLLARALYRKPRLLILDESTSHLDLATEKQVNTAIRSLGTARIIVAHRPDSILLADRILALTPQGLIPVPRQDVIARSAPPPPLGQTWTTGTSA